MTTSDRFGQHHVLPDLTGSSERLETVLGGMFVPDDLRRICDDYCGCWRVGQSVTIWL